MINVQHPLSATLAALLLKEFPRDQLAAMAAPRSLASEGDTMAIARFYDGLEEHRLDLRSDNGADTFCDVILGYLEALLDPGKNVLTVSGIETTASSAPTVWQQMTDVQQTSLWREAAALHTIIAPLVFE